MTDYLHLDIETIATDNPAHIADIAASVTPSKAMTKPESIAAWEKDTKPGLVDEAVSKTTFNAAYGRICCIAWAWNNEIPKSVSWPFTVDSEAEMLDAFVGHLIDTKPGFGVPTIVGHYVADFDIRFIWQRAFVLGVKMPTWFPRDPKPWSKEVHDTMGMWAGAKGSISMDNLCKALGVEGKGDKTGADVAGMWQRQEYQEIADYCRNDVAIVQRVHAKMMFSIGVDY